ncbi:MAG TPA: hypothetical protein VFU73_13525 [Actinocrinis sp.]|nr:hypothetical protein [Actinocrinis sp.]
MPAVLNQTTLNQTTTTQPAAARSGAAGPEPAPPDASQDPPAADSRLRATALEQPHTVANPRRVRVR